SCVIPYFLCNFGFFFFVMHITRREHNLVVVAIWAICCCCCCIRWGNQQMYTIVVVLFSTSDPNVYYSVAYCITAFGAQDIYFHATRKLIHVHII
ncbi:hypothetical protein ACJX0J_019377, partial [Zea mays]